MPEDANAAEQMVRQWQERAAEKAQKFDAMRSRVEQISVTESTRDGAVRVTVGFNGLLQGLQLSEAAANRPMAKLSTEIMRTVQLAQSKLPDLMQEAVADTVGTEDTAAQHVVSEARRNFPEAPEEDDADQGAAQTSGIQEMDIGNEDDSASPPPHTPPPQQPPTRGGKPTDEFDDDDFDDGASFLR
ncbi:YbaB/EbfC family nucleoid-associated protein [Parasphingorhabdus pacifica]